MNVVCLKWGKKYGPEYVNRLYAAIARNTTMAFKFHCFTEDSAGINPDVVIHDLPFKNLEGWWNKLYLFSKEMPITGRIFYVDLDTVITGNLDQLMTHNTGFVVLRDFYTGLARGLETQDNVGSGLMSWEAGNHTHLWETFIANPSGAINEMRPHGDQKWVQRHQIDRLYWQDLFPNQVVSFKVHCREGLAQDARLICYHGNPTIPQSISQTSKAQWWTIKPSPWVADYWKE